MKKVRKALLLFLGVWLLQGAYSQNALHIALAGGSVIPGQTDSGSVFAFNVLVRNDSFRPFQGFLYFNYRIDTTNYQFPDSISGFEFGIAHDSLFFGDTAVRQIIAHVNSPAFKVGPSVVVIWPIAFGGSSAYAKDSLKFNFLVTVPTAIGEIDPSPVKIRANSHELQIIRTSEIHLRQVRIYNILGKETFVETDPGDHIPLPDLDAGIYLAEITFNENRRKVFRFYR